MRKIQKTFFQACEEGDTDRINSLLADKKFDVNSLSPVDQFTGLHYAAEAGKLCVVDLLVSVHNADVNKRGLDGGTALHWACRTPSRAKIIKCLLDYGADPNSQGNFGRAAVHVCATRGLSENLRSLTKWSSGNINVNISDNPRAPDRGTTALHLAVYHGNLECVKVLLEAGALTSAKNTKDQLPIHLACMQSDEAIVKLLVQSDITRDTNKGGDTQDDLTAQDADQRTPLMYACLYGNTEVVRYLVNAGNNSLINRCINLDMPNSRGETALHCVAEAGNVEILMILLKGRSKLDVECHTVSHGYTPLHIACQHGHTHLARVLLENFADISARDMNGETGLMQAAAHGHVTMVQYMLESGADLSNHDLAGETAMFHAVKENRVEVVKYLLSLREDIAEEPSNHGNRSVGRNVYKDIDNKSNTPLHLAAQQGFCTCVSVLIESGYLLDVKNKMGFTPVHLAVREGRRETLQVILEKDSKCFHYEDKQFNTPLHLAAKFGQSQCCRLLLTAGADVSKQNIRGVTALHHGAGAGSKPACKLLLEHGSDVNMQDNNQDTALHYSARLGDVSTTEVLVKHGSKLNIFNEQGDNALLTAIRNNNEHVIHTIISADNWKSALYLNVADHVRKVQHAEQRHKQVFIKDNETGGDEITHNPLHQLIIHCPEQAYTVFDRCVHAEDGISEEKEDYWVEFDYSLVENTAGGTHPFTTMLQNNRISLLSHPLISSLITHKWRSYGRYWYYINVLLNTLFVILLTTYALLEVTPDTQNTTNRQTTLLSSLAVFVILFSIIRLFIEVLQAVKNTTQYFSDLLNYSEMFVFSFAICFVGPTLLGHVPTYWQWELGCFVTVTGWLNLIMCLKKLPYIGIYVIMIGINFSSFLKVLPSIFMFIIPFGLVFHMGLGSTFGTFREPGYSISKTLIMFLGEINYDMYFVPPSLDAGNPVKYPWSTYILFHLFVFCLPIILMNLLIGIAVEDVSVTLQTARLLRSAHRIDQIFLSEKLPFSGASRKVYPVDKVYPNVKMWFGAGHYYDFRGKDITEIMSRKRKLEQDNDAESLNKIQRAVNKLITNQTQIKDKLNVLYRLLENSAEPVAGSLSLDQIRFSNTRILDQE